LDPTKLRRKSHKRVKTCPGSFEPKKSCFSSNISSALTGLSNVLLNAWREHKYLFDTSEEAAGYYNAMKRMVNEQKIDPNLFSDALRDLTRYLSEYHQAHPVLLIDEYDTPVHEAWLNGDY
jgi:hypothetical protein